MSQNLDKKQMDRNLKLMILSATVLIVLFFYTIFKSSAHVQSSTYYVGIIFLILLFIFAIFARVYKDKLQTFFEKSRKKNAFATELAKEQEKPANENEYMAKESTIEQVVSNVTFDDVAGISSVKEELEEVVDFLNAPKKYLKYDVKLPKGVLLVGPPGVGKTLIARAVAGEAQVPFFYQSGASFVQIYVGMGAKKVRELFEKAKANAPAIIFIDEIDAIGKQRTGTSNDEREATLNELLTQMDGFEGDSGIIVIAATNKLDVLDDALLRAGRFDRRVHVSLPNIEDRKKILNLYLQSVKFEFDVDKLAVSLAGFSSAAIATLVNEAKLNMIKREDVVVTSTDIEIAKDKLEFGKKENKILDEAQREVLAVYQASKAFITKQRTTLFQEGIAKSDYIYPSKTQLIDEIRGNLAGFIGVEVITGELYAVNSDELKKADTLANLLVNEYAMAEDVKTLITDIKTALKTELSNNKERLLELKAVMLENEVVEANDI